MEWYRAEIDSSKLKELSERSNVKGFFYCFFHLFLIFISGFLLYFSINEELWIVLPFSFFMHGTFVSFLSWAGASHELYHGTVFNNKKINKFFLTFFAFLTWENKVLFSRSHKEHHRFTLVSDRDEESTAGARYKGVNFLYGITINLYAFKRKLSAHYNNALGNITGRWPKKLFPENDTQARRKMCHWSRTLLLIHLLSALLFVFIGYWELIFIVNLSSFFGNLLPNMLATAQHSQLQENTDDFRENSRTIILNKFLSMLYWNMNYHIEHHMYPSVPFYNLPKLREIIKNDLPEPVVGIKGVLQVI